MGKVMKADASAADAYAEFSFPSPVSGHTWLTFDLAFDADALVFWTGNSSGDFGDIEKATFPPKTGVALDHAVWTDYWEGGGTSPTPTPVAATWVTVELHTSDADTLAELYINGVLVASGGCSSNSSRKIRLGQFAASNDPAAVCYIDNVKAGTTRGATDLFSDGFEDETFDAWTTTSGDVSIVDDPFDVAHHPLRFYEPPFIAWRWFITDLRTGRLLTAITTIASEISTTRLLAAAWPASLTVPSDDPRINTTYLQFEDPELDEPFVARNIRALIGLRSTGTDPDAFWQVAYAGMVLQVADTVSDGTVPTTRVNAWDARKYLERLPLVDADGNLPGTNGITFTGEDANVIARAALENWITNNPGCLAETLFDLSSGLDETCAAQTMTFERGTTINDVWTALEQTGAIDIVLDPVYDPRARPGCLAVVNFEVEHGAQQNAAIFSWDRSPRSLPEITRMEDGLKLANTIQDYTDSIEPVDQATDPDSITKFGEWWAMRAWPGKPDADEVAAFAIEELVFMKDGQTTLTMAPAAARSAQPVQAYDIGDRVPVYASNRLRKPIAARARIYEIPFTIGDDSRERVSEVVVSADAVAA